MEKNNIKLSVIIPCYNHGQYLPEAIASIDSLGNRNQIEIIIINDGSTDELTNNYIDELDSQKYVIIKQENKGLASSRNKGVLVSKADYVLMLDADNFIEPVFIDDFFKIINNGQNFDALYGNAIHFGEENLTRKQGDFNLLKILQHNYIDACAIIKKDTLLKVGLYDQNMPFMGYEDWDLWIRLGLNYSKLKYVDKNYFHYRVLRNSMIRSFEKENFAKIKKYILVKSVDNKNFFTRIIEDYLNYYINRSVVFYLLLKKIRILKKISFINY